MEVSDLSGRSAYVWSATFPSGQRFGPERWRGESSPCPRCDAAPRITRHTRTCRDSGFACIMDGGVVLLPTGGACLLRFVLRDAMSAEAVEADISALNELFALHRGFLLVLGTHHHKVIALTEQAAILTGTSFLCMVRSGRARAGIARFVLFRSRGLQRLQHVEPLLYEGLQLPVGRWIG